MSLQYVQNYAPYFHPKAYLKNEIMMTYRKWKEFNSEISAHLDENSFKAFKSDTSLLIEELKKIILQKYKRLLFTDGDQKLLISYNMPCSVKELAKIAILRKIICHCHDLLETVGLKGLKFLILRYGNISLV
jgi:hypothetical protein